MLDILGCCRGKFLGRGVVENFRAYRLDILGKARSFGNFHSFFSFDMNTSQFELAQYVCDQWTLFFLVDPSGVIRSNLEKHV
jgi:hypothetical protein